MTSACRERSMATEKIFKYSLEVTDVQDVSLPSGAEVLCVQTQYGVPCVWAKVDPKAPEAYRRFFIYGTGHPVRDAAMKYVGTFQLNGGDLVFHVFEAL
jgi:hypothetical protein